MTRVDESTAVSADHVAASVPTDVTALLMMIIGMPSAVPFSNEARSVKPPVADKATADVYPVNIVPTSHWFAVARVAVVPDDPVVDVLAVVVTAVLSSAHPVAPFARSHASPG